MLTVVCLTTLSVLSGCSNQGSSGNRELTAFVGSSAKGAMDPSAQLFSGKTGIKVFINYGGSGTLLSQMELAKTGDLYIPASPDYIAKATADKAVFPETETRIYYLVPAILVQKGNPRNIKSLSDLTRPGLKIAIADPKTVPAGLYAYELLDFNGLLQGVGKNILAYGTTNEQISTYVILKTVDAAIAWDVVAIQQPQNLDVVYPQPNQIPRLSYMSGAISTYTRNEADAQSFLNFLNSPEVRAIFKQNGYYTTLDEAKKFAPDAQIGGEYKLPADYTPLAQ